MYGNRLQRTIDMQAMGGYRSKRKLNKPAEPTAILDIVAMELSKIYAVMVVL